MPRYKLTIEYDGTGYAGWQKQPDRPSIQQAIENALEKFCGGAVEVCGAGRTDAGVHATAQVAHIDLSKAWEPYKVMQGINFYLFNPDPHPDPLPKRERESQAVPSPDINSITQEEKKLTAPSPFQGEGRDEGKSWHELFAFTQEVGKTFKAIYPAIARRHMFKPWTAEQREWQLKKRGRYVEFNLLYDRGTRFGLTTGGNVDAILMSMPPEVKWP